MAEEKYQMVFYVENDDFKWSMTVPRDSLKNLKTFVSVLCYSSNQDRDTVELKINAIKKVQNRDYKSDTFTVKGQTLSKAEYQAIKKLSEDDCLVIQYKYISLDGHSPIIIDFNGNVFLE